MNNKIFSREAEDYIKNKMNICLSDLTAKIFLDAPSHLIFYNELIEFMIILEPPLEYGELDNSNNEDNNDYLNEKLFEFIKKYNIEEYSPEYFIFDNLRHTFTNYCEGGVYLMHKYREAEGWYPKIIINKNIGTRIDINDLDIEVTIYRGTSKDEYNSKEFGQAWTIDKNIANEFAFIHYSGQEDYQNTSRVVLKAEINRNNIYYFNRDESEKEVVINTKKIIKNSIILIEEKIID